MISILLARQLVVLFLIMGCGFLLVKLHLIKSQESRTLSVISLYLIMPCVIINAFQIDYSDQVRDGFLLALGAAFLIHVILFLLCGILGKFFKFSSVEKASLIYSNAGNLIIPLVTAVLGEEWVIYASAFLCVQTVILWTHGQALMKGSSGISWKKIFTNINLIAIVTGSLLFFTQVPLPAVLTDTIDSLSSTIGPVSMLVLGMLLAEVRWKEVFTGKRIYLMVFLKMLVFPGTVLLFLRFLSHAVPIAHAQTILLISLLAVTTPSATTITQMAQLYDNHAPYASAINVLTTVVCIVTMPLMIAIYTL